MILNGRRVSLIFLGFFGVVFAANAIMIWSGLHSFDGVETQDAYIRGRDYNQTLEDQRRQQALGWRISSQWRLENQAILVKLDVQDRAGAPLAGLIGKVVAWRPTYQGIDREKTLTELAPGRYQARLPVEAAGRWQLRFALRDAAGERMQWREDIVTGAP